MSGTAEERSATGRRSLRVLFVEDSVTDVELCLGELRKAGFEVTADIVETLREFAERLRARPYDIILADYNLPQWTGMGALEHLQHEGKDIPFILVTEALGEERAVECIKRGAIDYVLKDRLARLPVAVRGALEKKVLRLEHRRSDTALRESERAIATLMNKLPGMAYRCRNDRNWTMEFVSEGCFDVTGYHPTDLIQNTKRSYAELIHPDDQEFVRDDVEAAVQKRQPFLLVYRIITAAGEEKWVWGQGQGVFSPAGELVALEGFIADITERKRAEAALYESNRRLEKALAELQATQQQVLQQERLRALGQMASGIAHDFNNALSSVLGFSELLLDHPEYLDDKPKVTRYLRLMNTAAQDARDVVRRLREFYRSREEDEVLVPVEINQLVHQAISLTQPRWKDQSFASGITIHIETDLQRIPLAAANDAEVREVLTNLILNAVDAMPQGGTLTIRTRPEREAVVVEVSDTGVGMTEDVRDRCLEPFFSTKGEHGTGLGLAMVYGIIRRLNGTLDLDSEPGRGTTVVIRLPVATGQPDGRSQETADAPSRQLRILVVDDEPTMREVLTEFLTCDGHAVETASNGREGLEKFHAGWFDLVVTDRGMPEMSGDQFAAAIKCTAPDKPIIALTGFGDLMEASGEKPAGVNLVVCKPVTRAALRQALAKVTAV